MDQPILNAHNKDEHRPSHTAEHLLNQTMVRLFGCERSRNAHIERKKSKVNYCLPVCPTAEQVADIEARINALIAEDLADASETLRLVRIGDYDLCPCLGQHVEHTGEIGHFRITSTSYADGNFRIVFRVGAV